MVAGVGPPKYDDNGIEMTFAINFVNQALLFLLLREKGLLADDGRIVFVTTALHDPKQPLNQNAPFWTGAQTVSKGDDEKLAHRMTRYSTAKLGSIFFAYALARKATAAGKNWSVIAYEPGFVPGGGSRLTRGEPRLSPPLPLSCLGHS